MHKGKRWTGRLLAWMAVAATWLVAGTAAAAATQWKMHMVWVPARVEAQYYQKFVDEVNKQASGKLHIQLFPGATLGVKDVDMLRVLPRGNVIQIAGLYPGYMTRDEPEYAVTLPPGVVPQPEQLDKLAPTLKDIYQTTYDKWGIKLLGFVAHPVRDTHLMCKEPINTLEALKGKKVRVWEKAQADTFAKLGISAQIVGQNDLYMAMRTGVVDCSVYPIHFGLTVSLQEVAPNAAYLFPYVLHPLNIIVSRKAYDALPPDVQQILQNAANKIEQESFAAYLQGQVDKTSEDEWKKKGGTVLAPFPEADQKRFAEASREVWNASSRQAGGKAQENHERVVKALGW
ncbi:TRAP transporter substrate-binding protein DctP [Bordetella sp. BOR01]|uniref:TRAP transporter substrate-binding protein DctP n=1 Tax=Bordetella sp. BOR01 TaxID=2854779 RepID=UPI001C488C21|nr:TRAP transporter substrate-binding protein DctP [Bordetella sp. BOR01]MBV7485135.1 TRAP transporter substrate-binding protein DctP [Bordetella sp. BOR01]